MISTSSDKALKDDLKTTSGLHIGKMSYGANCSAELWPSPFLPGSLLLKAKMGVRNKTWPVLPSDLLRAGDGGPLSHHWIHLLGLFLLSLPVAREVGVLEPPHHTAHELCLPRFPCKGREVRGESQEKKISSFQCCTLGLINPYIRAGNAASNMTSSTFKIMLLTISEERKKKDFLATL